MTHVNSSALLKACFIFFYLHFALDIILGVVIEKDTKKDYFIQVKPHLFVLEFSNNITL